MDTVSPSGADVYLRYVCPHCAIKHILSRQDTQKGKITCACRKSFKIKPVEFIDVTPVYGNSEDRIVLDRRATFGIIDEAADRLMNRGYSRGQSIPILTHLTKQKKYLSSVFLVQEFLRSTGHGE